VWHACVPLRRLKVSRSKVHGRVQSPVGYRYPLLHTALLLCPPSLHSLILRSLVSKLSHTPSLVSKLSYCPSLVSKLSYSPTLVSKLNSYPIASRRSVTTRIRRVSGKRPAICCCCCLDLWGVIQLLTFHPYYGKHLKARLKLVSGVFLHILAFEPLRCSCRLPRCSLDAFNSIEFLHRWSSSS